MSSTDGVVQLNQAKKNAMAKIEEARTRKQRRVKEAKDLAKAEIDAYKQQKEEHFKLMEQKNSLSYSGAQEAEFLKSSLKEIEKSYAQNKEKALETLVNHVLNVRPELHTNFLNRAA